MKNSYQAALVVALGLASISAAKAQTYGDLIAGFTTQSGNDQIVDLGNISTLFPGETWSPATLGISAGSVSSYSWGVIGDATAGTATGLSSTYDTILSTTLTLPPPTANSGTFAQVNTGVNSIIQNFSTYASGGPNPGDELSIPASFDDSWSQQTINGKLTTQIVNSYGNPNGTGSAWESLWSTTDNGAAPSYLGAFNLDPNGNLTFEATPEPTTYALCAAGLSLFSFRRLFFRKQA